jgi:hypothetical protein
MTLTVDRSALVTDLVKAMNDTNDLDVRRIHFAEAALKVVVNRGVTLPTGDDLSDLTDEIADAMWDSEIGPDWNHPEWHPYADAVITVLGKHDLLQVA